MAVITKVKAGIPASKKMKHPDATIPSYVGQTITSFLVFIMAATMRGNFQSIFRCTFSILTLTPLSAAVRGLRRFARFWLKKKKIAKKNRQIFSISRPFIRKNLPRVKCRLCIQSFIILGQGVPELQVRTDSQSNFVPKSISIFESQIHRCFLDLHTTEQCIHSTNEKLLFKTT